MITPPYFYPRNMGRIILLGMEEVIGREGVEAVLRLAALGGLQPDLMSASSERTFSFESISRIQQALEQEYGLSGGHGAAWRIGRACFKYGLKEYGQILGVTETAFQLLPLSVKLHTGARSLADLFNTQTDQKVRVEETETHFLWHIERCPLCWGRTADVMVCHLAAGLLQESLYWLSGGRVFNVEETACHARGDAYCSLAVQKIPLV